MPCYTSLLMLFYNTVLTCHAVLILYSMSFIVIYTTHENAEEAQKITSHLLEGRLIACANILPIEACYWWQGAIATANEYVAILKTRSEYWEHVRDEIERIHPYDVPCIMKIEVEANERYEQWIRDETRGVL